MCMCTYGDWQMLFSVITVTVEASKLNRHCCSDFFILNYIKFS